MSREELTQEQRDFIEGMGDECVNGFVASRQDLEVLAEHWAEEMFHWRWYLEYQYGRSHVELMRYAEIRFDYASEFLAEEKTQQILADARKNYAGPSVGECFHKRAGIPRRINEMLQEADRLHEVQIGSLVDSYDDDPSFITAGVEVAIEETQRKLAVLMTAKERLPAAIEAHQRALEGRSVGRR